MPGHVMATHPKLCLLRNTRLALVATVLFAGGGVLYLLKLANELPVARHDPLLPFLLVGAAILIATSLKFFACLAERVILLLMLMGTLFKLVSLVKPQLFTGILHWQQITGAVISFSCAAISGFAAFRSLSTPGPESRRLQE
jgi:hypothetical protein